MLALAKRFLDDRRGATAVEYAVLISILGVIMFSAFQMMGTAISDEFTNIAAKMK